MIFSSANLNRALVPSSQPRIECPRLRRPGILVRIGGATETVPVKAEYLSPRSLLADPKVAKVFEMVRSYSRDFARWIIIDFIFRMTEVF